jgi:hypothetical protein
MAIIAVIVVCSMGLLTWWILNKPIDADKLLTDYLTQTAHLSFVDGIRKASAFEKFCSMGRNKVVPLVIDEIRRSGGNMALYVVLWRVTGIRPHHPMVDGVIKYDIKDEEKAWLSWAEKQGI